MRKLLLVIFLLVARTSFATTYWVGTSGNNANSCATASGSSDPGASNRKATPAGGIACLSAGDTLKIGNGTYNTGAVIADNIPSGSSAGAPTIITAENIVTCSVTSCVPNVIFRPTSGLAASCCIGYINGNNHILIQGISFDCSGAGGCSPFYVDGTANTSDGLRWEDDVFANGSCSEVTGLEFADCSGLEPGGQHVINASIKRSHATTNGPTSYHTHGFYIANGGTTIEDSYAAGNGGWGFHGYCGAANCSNLIMRRNVSRSNGTSTLGPSCGFIVQNVDNVQVYNNIAEDDGSGCAIEIKGYCSTSCLVGFNTTPDSISESVSDTVTVTSNIRGSYSGTSETTGLAYSSGLFVDASNHNFHLLADDGGGTANGTVTSDFDGVMRNNPPDRGAFEFSSGAPPASPTVPVGNGKKRTRAKGRTR